MVAVLFNHLRELFPEMTLAAFLDDRALVTDPLDQLMRAVQEVADYDNAAGHKTNLNKSVLFSTSPKTRKQMQQVQIAGQKMKVALNSKMVGHDVTVRRAPMAAMADTRADEARMRARRIQWAPVPWTWKHKLLTTAAAPVLSYGSLWEIPCVRTMNALRTAFADALWGAQRKQRCVEVLLGTVHDPTKVDPLSILMYARARDARRLFRKSQARAQKAMRMCQATDEPESSRDNVKQQIQGPVHALRQLAAILGGKLCTDGKDLWVDVEGYACLSLLHGDQKKVGTCYQANDSGNDC